ncbi:serine dehydratase [Flavobacteriales bacterium 34_180_T64]|nr:serine dehydratase [Flavobacteriales bacterium 34_180_T64]
MIKTSLAECHSRIQPYIHKTAVISSRLINEMIGIDVVFKCENFQKMGAFKMRGATNAIMQLSETQKARGVVTHSSGNFAQALSLAASSLEIKAYIVMPNSAPEVKVDAVKGYGGIISFCEPTIKARVQASNQIIHETDATFIHPSNDMNVILGNGTACIELLEDHPELDVVFVPIGGGGLIAGTALAAHYYGNNCEVIGGEPFEVDDAYRSLQNGKIEYNKTTNTIADGLKTHLGDINFPIIQNHVNRIIRVEEFEIVSAMKLIYERLKIVIEPSSAVAFAALLKEKTAFKNKKVAVLISGGNVNLNQLPF